MFVEAVVARRAARRLQAPLVAAVCAFGVASPGFGVCAESGHAKPHAARKTFDLTPPHPGEMLANPSKGSGSPPQLKEFAPSAALHLSQDEAGDATTSPGGTDPGKAGVPVSLAAGPPVQPSPLQLQLTAEIARVGIDGFLSRPPQAASGQDQQFWDSVRHELAASLATWQTLYASAPGSRSGGASKAPSSPPSLGPEPGR